MAARKLLITGATGKQGGAVVDALLSSSTPFQILALTRNPSSAKAKALAARPNVTVVEGDPTSPAAIFEAHKPIYGVFLVTAFAPGKAAMEEQQATPMIDEALKNGVEHFVFTSVDRGGPVKSEGNPTNIPHFASKYRIEEQLKKKSAGTKMGWTILRPVAFMDNFVPGFQGKVFASMWADLGDKPLQLIATRDIGIFAAKAFANPEKYKGEAIALAGDELNLKQAKEVFKQSLGYDMPETFGFVGSAVRFMVKEMGLMFSWFKTDGYQAGIPELRKEEPTLQDFGTWLKESSAFKKQ